MDLIATLLSFFTLGLLVVLAVQMRRQYQATAEMLTDTRIRTRLYEDADESTSLILSRTIDNIRQGQPDASLANDEFAIKVVRELVKRRLGKDRWLEIQSNERLIHELYLLLRDRGN